MTNQLTNLNQEIAKFQDLEIARTCTQPVFGYGNPKAKVVFIGEAPGKEEDLTGRPFVGRSGKLLDELLKSINLTREEVYITNIVKFRPPENRDPTEQEKKLCKDFLKRELAIIKPKLIVTLGRHAMSYFDPKLKISEAHGKPIYIKCDWNKKQLICPLYHPAVALYNPNNKTTLFSDFKQISQII